MAIGAERSLPLRERRSRGGVKRRGSRRSAGGHLRHALPLAARPVSQSALWSQRLAVFAVPFLATAVIGHRIGAIETAETFWLLALSASLLVLTMVLAVVGFHQLWTRGAKGGLRALRGFALAALLFLPFAWFGMKAFTLPAIAEVSTDWDDPPQFDASEVDRGENANAVGELTSDQQAAQLAAYPTLVKRRYAIDIDRVFKAVAGIVEDRDWTILAQQAESSLAGIDVEGSALTAVPNRDAAGNPMRSVAPTFRPPDFAPRQSDDLGMIAPIAREDEVEERFVEAVATSFLFGFESDVLVRLVEDGEETLVDMRAASRFGSHDLGANAGIVEEFLNDLDAALQGVSAGAG